MTAPLLETRGLKAFYGPVQVLHGLDIAVEHGGVTALLGANGAGKTTTLRALCAMVRCEGAILYDGRPITTRACEDIVRLGLAHAPEGRGTFTDLSVEENLRLGAYTRSDRAAVKDDFDAGLRLFSAPRGTPRPAGGHAVGRRAADAGDRPRADAAAEAPAARRAVVRSRADHRQGHFPHPARDQPRGSRQHADRRAERQSGARPRRSRLSHRDRPGGGRRRGERACATTIRCAASILAIDRERG